MQIFTSTCAKLRSLGYRVIATRPNLVVIYQDGVTHSLNPDEADRLADCTISGPLRLSAYWDAHDGSYDFTRA